MKKSKTAAAIAVVKEQAISDVAAAQVLSLSERIDKKRQLQGRLSDARSRLTHATSRRDQVGKELRETREALAGYQGNGDVPPHYRQLRADLQRQIEALSHEFAEANAKIEGANQEIKSLEVEELPACLSETTVADVIVYQQRLNDAAQAVARLEATIAEQKNAAEAAFEAPPSLESLYREREDLLAAVALGEATHTDLEALEGRIAEEAERVYEANEELATKAVAAQQTRAGLERKLADVRRAFQELQSQRPEVLAQFLHTEAQRICAQYIDTALLLKERFLQLHACDELIRMIAGGDGIARAPAVYRLSIPTFNLPQCGGLDIPGRQGIFFSSENMAHASALKEAAVLEKARLRALGIEIPS